MADERWMELLSTVQREVWRDGFRSVCTLLEVQAQQLIPPFSTRPWPAQHLQRAAAVDYLRMRHAAKASGIWLWIKYGWRAHELQALFYSQWKNGTRKLRPAEPGWSRHEYGIAIDIMRSHDCPEWSGVKGPEVDQWMAENAKRFGWHRLPEEPWHWEHAASAKRIAT